MFKLKFGIIWTIFTSVIFGLIIFVPASGQGGDNVGWEMILFILIFEAIGIIMLVSGARQVITDKKTDKYGIITYGRISQIHPTGANVNGVPELAAEIVAYVPERLDVEIFSEIIGVGTMQYKSGMYLLLKFYEGDVNIIQIIKESSVPTDVLEKINSI